MMHSLMQVPVKFVVFCFAHAYRDRSETYYQRNIKVNTLYLSNAGNELLLDR